MDATHIVQGQYFLPLSSKSQSGLLSVTALGEDRKISVRFGDGTTLENLVTDDVQGHDNFHFVNGSYFKADEPIAQDVLLLFRNKSQRRVTWLETFTLPKAIGFATLFVLCILTLRLMLPTMLHGLVAMIPDSLEQSIGENAYDSMQYIEFVDSEIPEARQESIRKQARLMAEKADLQHNVQIFFRGTKHIGANAMAFPGGPIVVTDELVKLLGSDEEVLAVLAHEMAHVEKRHSLQQLFAIIGASAFVYVVFGVDDSIVEELSAAAINVWAFKNSRGFEEEADLEGIKILKAAQIDPQNFLNAIDKLVVQGCGQLSAEDKAQCIEKKHQVTSDWASSHPAAKSRLTYIHKALAE